MAYKLRFHELAWAEWQKLDGSIKTPLKKKLLERLEQPRVPAAALSGMADCYKIKLHQASGYQIKLNSCICLMVERKRLFLLLIIPLYSTNQCVHQANKKMD